MDEALKADAKIIFALTLVHFTGDFYASFINPLLPVFVEKFSLSMTEVGLVAGISRFLAFIVQPAAGYIADHYRTRLFVLGGPLLAMAFIPLTGIAPSFLTLVLFIALGSVGQSMFHPPSAGMVSIYSGRHLGLSMSIFNMGGTLAFGAGPLFIAYIVHAYGLEASPWTMMVGLPLLVILFKLIPVPETEGLGGLGLIGSIKECLGPAWRPISLIWVVMVLRAFVSMSFLTFIPVLYAREGFSLLSIGTVVSLFTVAGTISGLLAGHFSDRVGYRPIFFISHALTTPAFYLLLYLRGSWVYSSSFLAGFFAMATLPLGVTFAQELAPKGKSMVSSLMMGLAFGTGGMMAPLAGKMADIYSIQTILACLAIIPLGTLALISRLPERNVRYSGAVF
jgi:FSR family fosmidomycin resistance protein-like MFS transporter